jgi:hypothetical protein
MPAARFSTLLAVGLLCVSVPAHAISCLLYG